MTVITSIVVVENSYVPGLMTPTVARPRSPSKPIDSNVPAEVLVDPECHSAPPSRAGGGRVYEATTRPAAADERGTMQNAATSLRRFYVIRTRDVNGQVRLASGRFSLTSPTARRRLSREAIPCRERMMQRHETLIWTSARSATPTSARRAASVEISNGPVPPTMDLLPSADRRTKDPKGIESPALYAWHEGCFEDLAPKPPRPGRSSVRQRPIRSGGAAAKG